jgi:hypothetical protein
MKVFISWSGPQTRAIGDILRQWMPSVLQAAKPYFSPDDVSKGARWSAEIAKELETSQVGLLLLTRDNQTAPWLIFEAGALAKNLDRSKVCPILFGDLTPSDIEGPLVQFQGASFSKEEMKRVMRMVNAELKDQSLGDAVFDTVFDKWWPDLQSAIDKALKDHASANVKQSRSERDILNEVLSLTRQLTLNRGGRNDRDSIDHPAFIDLIDGLHKLVEYIRSQPADDEVGRIYQELLKPLQYYERSPKAAQTIRRLSRAIKKYGLDEDFPDIEEDGVQQKPL